MSDRIRRSILALLTGALVSSPLVPAPDVSAGGDAPDPCAARLRWVGERTTFADAPAPTEVVVVAETGAEPVEVTLGRVELAIDGRARNARVGRVTDDAGRRQPRRIRLAPHTRTRLHVRVTVPSLGDHYPFTVEARAGTCRYDAEAYVRREPVAPVVEPTPPPTLETLVCPSGMVSIPGGTFSMGSEDGLPEELPVHSVTVSSFCMDRTEVTIEAYAACVTAGVCLAPAAESTWYDRRTYAGHPINSVDHTNATNFCRFLGRRLPTEEEWEYAARGGDAQRVYPWGDQDPVDGLCFRGQPTSPSRFMPCPAGAFPADVNRWGVLDLGANLAEWTSSGWSSDYASPRSTPVQSPGAPAGTLTAMYVVRGGNFLSDAVRPPGLPPRHLPRAARRVPLVHVASQNQIGFRCVSDDRSAPPARRRR